MATLSTPLSSAAQASYTELLDVVRHEDLTRSIANLSGSFSRKTSSGKHYWYYQATDVIAGGTRQIFVGPDTEEVRGLVERSRTKDMKPIAKLAAAAAALGCASTTPVQYRIVRRLNETGIFRAGSVLVGSHAFLAYGNLLGVSWKDSALTKDVDFAHAGRAVALALPHNLKLETRKNVEALENGFLPVGGFFPGEQTATFVAKLRVDFLTPMVGGREAPFFNAELGVNLQPLRFLDIILEDIYQAAILSTSGATLVNVPDPARYALHKLLVHVERRKRNTLKAEKDLRQAASLIEVLWDHREEDLGAIWESIVEAGPGWRQRAKQGMAALAKLAADLPAVPALQARLPG